MQGAAVSHGQGTRTSMVMGVAPLVVLRPDEIGQHLTVRPPRCALVRPAIEISSVSADIDHSVYRGTAAECSAARQIDPPIPETPLRLGRKVPIVLGL